MKSLHGFLNWARSWVQRLGRRLRRPLLREVRLAQVERSISSLETSRKDHVVYRDSQYAALDTSKFEGGKEHIRVAIGTAEESIKTVDRQLVKLRLAKEELLKKLGKRSATTLGVVT